MKTLLMHEIAMAMGHPITWMTTTMGMAFRPATKRRIRTPMKTLLMHEIAMAMGHPITWMTTTTGMACPRTRNGARGTRRRTLTVTASPITWMTTTTATVFPPQSN